MGKAKIAIRSQKNQSQIVVEDHLRWTVVDRERGKNIYLLSENGITEEEALRLESNLGGRARAVPVAALDRFGRLQEDRLEEAIAASVEEED